MLRGGDRAGAVARLDRRARAHSLRQPEVRAGRAGRRDARLRQRVRRAVPGDGRGRRPASPTTSARSSATASRRGCGGSAARRRICCGSTSPPDAAVLLRSPEISQQAYILWDLIHDRAHSHGDLPFDPFMIRQRAPYWMYSLEELRCDLTAFGSGGRARAERPRVRAATSSTRSCSTGCCASRSPGSRVRNYDGLGGQLLFAYLHRQRLPALDRQPPDDRVGAGRARAWPDCATRSTSCTAPGSIARSSSTGRGARPGGG